MKKRIGLALSGGGMRAAVFHLGVLKALAKHKMLAQVSHISTVSGASICMGLIYGCNRNCWPNDDVFLTSVLPKIKAMITQKDIQWNAILRLIVEPYYWDKKVNLLANVMEKRWKVSGCLFLSIPNGQSILPLMKQERIFVWIPHRWVLYKVAMS